MPSQSELPMVTAHVLLPSLASVMRALSTQCLADCRLAAEFRGPGMRHAQQFDDSPDDYDLEMDNRSRAFSVRAGRIILLGDGTEVHADQDEEELFDATEEDKDPESQVRPRERREDTPGP